MHPKEVGKNLYLIDLKTGGFRDLIAGYILQGTKTAIVETGPTSSIPNLLSGLEELEIKPEEITYVAITHIHLDHGGGAGTLLKNLPNAKVIVHPKGAEHISNPSALWEASKKVLGEVANMFGEPEPVPKDRIIISQEGMTFNLGEGSQLKVVESPGHASHNLSYYEYSNKGIFPGDAAGAYLADFDVVFPTTPPPFHPDIALISLDKLIKMNPEVLYYSHFGKTAQAVKRLRDYQIQIKLWLSIVEEGVKKGLSNEQITERVLTEDETIRKAVPSLKENAVNRKTLIDNSVLGFIEFARNPQI